MISAISWMQKRKQKKSKRKYKKVLTSVNTYAILSISNREKGDVNYDIISKLYSGRIRRGN